MKFRSLFRSPDAKDGNGGAGVATPSASAPAIRPTQTQVVPEKTTFIDNTTAAPKANPLTQAFAKAAEALKGGKTLAQVATTPVAPKPTEPLTSAHPRDLAVLGKTVTPGATPAGATQTRENDVTAPAASPAGDATGDANGAGATPAPDAAEGQPEANADASAEGDQNGEAQGDTVELTWNPSAQRWQAPNGQFVEGEPPEGVAIDPSRPQAEVNPSALEQLAQGVEAGTVPTTEAEVVAIPGRMATDPELELEVEDKETAERLRQLKNGFMRGEDVRAAKAQLDAREQQLEAKTEMLAEVEDMIAAGPEVFLLERVKPETQLSVAKQLVLEYWDQLAPEIEKWFVDPTSRREAWVDAREARVDMKRQVTQRADEHRTAQAIYREVKAIVPETIEPERRDAFLKFAMRELSELARERDVTPANAKQLLAPALKLFGFTSETSPAATAAGTNANPASSRLGANATAAPNTGAPNGNAPASQTPTAAPVAPATPTPARITKTVTRPRPAAVTQARQNAAAVAPAGAGAVPVARPAMPKGLGLLQTIDYLRQNGAKIDVGR